MRHIVMLMLLLSCHPGQKNETIKSKEISSEEISVRTASGTVKVRSPNLTVSKLVEGVWSVDTIYYGKYDIKQCLLSNMVVFKETQCDLPISEDRCEDIGRVYSGIGAWEAIETDSGAFFIRFKTENKLFKGQQRIIFRIGDSKGLLKMEIGSDSLYAICSKGLYDYRKHMKYVKTIIDR